MLGKARLLRAITLKSVLPHSCKLVTFQALTGMINLAARSRRKGTANGMPPDLPPLATTESWACLTLKWYGERLHLLMKMLAQ